MSYTRFAIYYLPPEGALARFGATWLGWDVAKGQPVEQPDIHGIDAVTDAPRKYGFHGTLKPPFRLAAGQSAQMLRAAVAELAATTAPARCDGLRLAGLGRFLALVPYGDMAGLERVAGVCVTGLDPFRAPAPPQELARRRAAGLSARQETLLQRWGYPYVLEEFRFHLTLSGALSEDGIAAWQDRLRSVLPDLPAPFEISSVALVGERADGCFELIQRYPLTG